MKHYLSFGAGVNSVALYLLMEARLGSRLKRSGTLTR